ncbi:hypothetical protein CRM22_008766 [Opisthorchis felineus]|uniref:Uncharacterized protein n=1 Tax=Opisthorchis felineus TaxID=147828 RepID=A0A4S2L9T5_OPIFE|nr:hypothetical protein CRM22_008766 [Opisthorchis felineus]
MIGLALYFSIIAVEPIYSRKFDLIVRAFIPGGLLQDVAACETLRVRNQLDWRNGMFTSCTYLGMLEYSWNDKVAMFQVQADASLLSAYQLGLSSDVLIWYFNRELNGDMNSCLTSTGGELDEDGSGDFILVGPWDPSFCQKVTNKDFVGGQLRVTSCQSVERTKEPVDFQLPSKYELTLLRNDHLVGEFHHTDNHVLFLKELNGPRGPCNYNGYWAKV